jgi:hypothetical protein
MFYWQSAFEFCFSTCRQRNDETDKWFRDLLESELKEAELVSSVHCKENFESKDNIMEFLFSTSCLISLKLINFLVVIGNKFGTEEFRE